jgi:Caspase domain
VNQLRTIFDQNLGYQTDAFEIPPQSPASALNQKVADFVHKYDDKNTLLVLYYAGHGFEEDENAGLSIAALDEGDGEHGDPRAFFPDVMRLLHVAHSDVFLIIDCCFASKAFLSERHGRRKFELLASSMSWSPSPGRPGSFTAALIKVLTHLLNEPKHKSGFSTSVLYSHLFHCPDLAEYKPLLFDQSQFDYGKIWLRPQKWPADTPRLAQPSDVTLDLKIHLSLTKQDPIGLAMNELAKALKYLPHVHYIDYGELHAGDEEVAMFQQALSRASNVKKAIRLLRNKVKERKKKEPENVDPRRPIKRPPSFNQVLLKIDSSSTQDWSSAVAEFSNGTVVPLKSTSGVQNEPTNAIQPSLQTHQRRRAWSIPGIFYLRYIIDFTGVWVAMARLVERLMGRMPEQRSDLPHKHADVHPTVSNNPEATSSTDFNATSCGRESKRHGRRLLGERITERIFWFLCLCTLYMWSTGKM